MAGNEAVDSPSAEIFKALGDPIRWSILAQIADAGELACISLENTLPVSKPTISYHTKILQQADLISVRKTGRNYYYSLRDDVIHDLLDALWELAPAPRPVVGNEKSSVPKGRRQRRNERAGFTLARPPHVDRSEDAAEAAILTW
jgi:DNA-binding transcriptional ArsR family regulator